MQAMQFEQSVLSIIKRDKRFDPHAYFFLKDALDFTLKRVAEGNGGQARHHPSDPIRGAAVHAARK